MRPFPVWCRSTTAPQSGSREGRTSREDDVGDLAITSKNGTVLRNRLREEHPHRELRVPARYRVNSCIALPLHVAPQPNRLG